MLTSISNMFYMEIVHGISECANAEGYDILLSETDGLLEKQIQGLEKVKNRISDGAVILESTIHDDVLLSLEEKYPVIQCCSFNEEIDLPYIIVDNEKSGRLAAEELMAAGRGRFAFVGTNDKSMYNRKRRSGFLGALEDKGITKENVFVINSPLSFEGGRRAVRELRGHGVDGVFFVSDMQAVGAVREFFENGVDIPRDVSVIGHDNLELCDVVMPPLTSISQPAREMGRDVAKVLIGRLKDGAQIKGYKKIFQPELVRRGSV
jgi:DNA-binding LacI/PurR family transcriptional regulator